MSDGPLPTIMAALGWTRRNLTGPGKSFGGSYIEAEREVVRAMD